MGVLCSMHGRDEKFRTKFHSKDLKGRDHSEYVGVDGWIILEWIFGKRCGKV
jgi:hypothetical protein